MAKIKILCKTLVRYSIVFLVLTLFMYGLGRLFHIFPPVKALVQITKIIKIKDKQGKNEIKYSVAIDKLADIYFDKEFSRRGRKKRELAIENFVQYGYENTLDYALCLFKHKEYLREIEDVDYKSKSFQCQHVLLMLHEEKKLDSDTKSKLVGTLLMNLEFETDYGKRIQLLKNGVEIYDSIKSKKKEVIEIGNFLFLELANTYSENYQYWLLAQDIYEELLNNFNNEDKFKYANLITRIYYSRLLIKLQDYTYALNLLENYDEDAIRESYFYMFYKKQLADAYQGLGMTKEAREQIESIEILNYKKDPNVQFLTFSRKAESSLAKGNFLKTYYYMQRTKWLLRKSELKDSNYLFRYYFLEYLFSTKYAKSKTDLWKTKVREVGNKSNNENMLDFRLIEAQIERSDINKYHYTRTLELYTDIKEDAISRFKYLTENQRESYWQRYNEIVDILYEVSFEKRDSSDVTENCYNAALFSKGITLSTSIEFSKLLSESNDSSLILEYYKLLNIHQKINSLTNSNQEVDSLRTLMGRLERDLIAKSHEFGDYTSRMLISWKDVQFEMKDNDVAIEFIDFSKGDDSTFYAALVLRREWNAPKLVHLFEEKELLQYFDVPLKKDYSKEPDLEIRKLVWDKLLSFCNIGDNVYFAATKHLHKIAIESLPLNSEKYINELYNFSRVSSTKELYYSQNMKQFTSAVLYGNLDYSVASDEFMDKSKKYKQEFRGKHFKSETFIEWESLSQTKNEIDSINQIMRKGSINPHLFTGSDGNEESFKSLSGSSNSIIHIATHGFYISDKKGEPQLIISPIVDNFETPLQRSGLILSGANRAWRGEEIPNGTEDGVLTALEVSSLNFRNTDLVVLSACQTALGDINGEGVFGLQRGFKKAGVQTLVMSLWSVDDRATNIFMSYFYENLLSGNSKREAFILAQKSLRDIEEYSSPFYWAAFIMLD